MGKSVARQVWLWPNLLSLDAPALALLWQHFLAVAYNVSLAAPARAVLGLTVWSIYLGDRLLDAAGARLGPEPTRRDFYRKHFRSAMFLLAAVLAADAWVTLTWLRPTVRGNGFVLLAGVAGYLLIVHASGRAAAKEPMVALLFAAGTFLAPWTNADGVRSGLWAPAAAFFLLCLANLLAIEKWEWEELRDGAQPPHWLTAALVKLLPWGVTLLALLGASGGSPWHWAVAASSAAIGALLWAGASFSLDARRVLVDAALLSPLLFFP